MWTTLSRITATLVLAVTMSSHVRAHEVLPTITDLSVADGAVTLDIALNLEALLAGINLDAVEDTDDAPGAADYDALRALPDDELATRALGLVTGWNDLPILNAEGQPLPLRVSSVEVAPQPDIELPREARMVLTGDLPQGAGALTVAWPDGAGDLVVRQQGVDAPFTGLIGGGGQSDPIAIGGGGAQNGWQAFVSYLPVGFDHILPKGLDHILFVLGLFFLSMQLRPLLWQVSAFTLAHTVTLALGALGLVNVPASIVEPLIAASIVYVAVENIFASNLKPWRPFVVMGFGLLHGLGFASVLGEFGLPQAQFIPALIGFNVGVELGQLAVIAMAAILLWLAVSAARVARLEGTQEMVTEYPVMFRAVSITGSILIAIIGAYWVVERVFF